jgi:hypothetical protein
VILGIIAQRRGSGLSGPPVDPPVEGLDIINHSLYDNETASTSHAVDLPASIVSGRLLLLMMRPGSSSTAITTPSGWTLVGTLDSTGRTSIFARVTDGTEGASVSISLAASRTLAAVCYQINGADGLSKLEANFSGGNIEDPPSITASWGSADNLFIALMTTQRSNQTIDAPPTNYVDAITAGSGFSSSSTYSRVAAAHRFVTAATDDPGVFSRTGAVVSPHSATVVIGPAE